MSVDQARDTVDSMAKRALNKKGIWYVRNNFLDTSRCVRWLEFPTTWFC
jgi:hypothetical protein